MPTTVPVRRPLVALVALVLAASLLPWAIAQGVRANGGIAELFFSEYIEGSSNNKALEIYNGTGAPVDLAAGSYSVFMSFNGGSSTLTIALTGTVAAGDVFVLAQSAADPAILAQADLTNGSGWFNGDDAVVLQKNGTAVDSIGQIGFDPGSEWGTGLVSTQDNTLRRMATICAGDADATDAFDPAAQWDGYAQNTFDGLGAHTTTGCGGTGPSPSPLPSPSPSPDPCQLTYTPIYDIQGSGASAAITGTVTTEGVVVGDFEGPTSVGLQGFYLQDPTGDGDPATSDGIFVYTGSNASVVEAGDVVRVTGYARERFGQTAINGSNSNSSPVSAIVACGGPATVTPTDVTLPFAASDAPERYEGMLVRLPQALVISEYFNYDRFGEMVLALPLDGEDRPYTPTSVEEPGAPAQARALANGLRRITLDDGLGAQNPPVVRHPNGAPFSLTNLFRGGDTVTDTVGVLGYDFSLYRIQPTAPATYTAVNPRPAAPAPVGGDLRVASLNTLNYFLTPDYRTGDPLDNACGPLQDMECRGWDADQSDELTRQRTKLLATLAGLDADVIGLNELENTAGVEPLADLVDGLDSIGAGEYAYVDTGTIGTDAIKVGLLYRPAAVTPVGDFAILDTTVDPRFLDDYNRPVLAQTFEENATGARFTVAVNHLKSKGSSCNAVGDPDTGDGQGNCNLTRKAAAEALVDWLATDPTGSGDRDALIIGDLNSYAMEDPIDAVKAGSDDVPGTADDYVNLIARYQGTYAYSYVFDGQAGYLDHALASSTMAAQVTGAADWHINADESDLLDYDTSFKPPEQDAIYEPNTFRSSDHDPLVIGLDLTAYAFDGFYPPLAAAPADYRTKAGSRIPVKWSLGGDFGLDVLDGAPQVYACDGWPFGPSVDAASNPLVYDATDDQYKLEWKTDKAWAGTCRTIEVRFVDGTFRLVHVDFR